MNDDKKMVLGVIPARGGSKGVPGKNIRYIGGKPLIAYAIKCGTNSRSIDHLLVSTDSPEIAEKARQFGADVPFMRPVDLAGDTTPMLPVIQHATEAAEACYGKTLECLVLIDPTAPLRRTDDIEKALKLFRENRCDAVLSANKAHRNPFFNMVKIDDGYATLVNQPDGPVGRRQDAPEVFDLNTVVWIYSRKALMQEQQRIPSRSILYIVPSERAIDLDTELDFQLIEFHMHKSKGK